MTIGPAAEPAAAIVHALALAGGELPLRDAVAGQDLRDSDAALSALDAMGVVRLSPDGILRFGARGSSLNVAEVTKRLTTRELGRPLEVVASAPSTNDLVHERAAAGAAPGLAVCAELQTQGRGRRGRSFYSRPGSGLWCSVLLPVPADPAAAPRLSLVVGLAVCAALEDVAPVQAVLKWPNDVRVAGRKICGVLIEARSAGKRLFPVAGMGVNVHHRVEDFPVELRETAGSVQQVSGTRVERNELLARLLGRLEEWVDRERGGSLDLCSAFAARDEMRGREVMVETGGSVQQGVSEGIAPDGSLLLAVPGHGTVRVRAGEATLRPCS